MAFVKVERSPAGSHEPNKHPLFLMPSLGGPTSKLIDDRFLLHYSPNGRWMLSHRTNPVRLYVVPTSGGPERQLAAHLAEVGTGIWVDNSHVLLFGVAAGPTPRAERMDWWVASVDDKAVIRTGAYEKLRSQVLDPKRTLLAPPHAWYRGKVIFSARKGEVVNLWSLPLSTRSWTPTGDPERLTFGTGLEAGARVSNDGKIVFVSEQRAYNLHEFDVEGGSGKITGEARQVTRNSVYNFLLNASVDGHRLVYVSNRSGDWELWARELSSGKEVLLFKTSDHMPIPAISRDGLQVVFTDENIARDTQGLLLLSSSGGATRKLCQQCGYPVAWTTDGKTIIVQANRRDLNCSTCQVGIVDVASGSLRIASRKGLDPLALSPDGSQLVVESIGDRGRARFLAGFAEGRIAPESEWQRIGEGCCVPKWSPAGNLLYMISTRDGNRCIWAWNYNTRTKKIEGDPFPAKHFHDIRSHPATEVAGPFALAGNRLIISLAQISNEMWSAQLK
jgi:Tol biopolymer transport system component